MPIADLRFLAVPLAAALLSPACTGGGSDPASDFRLTLVPVPLKSQKADLLAANPDVKLVIDHPDGSSEVLYAGQAKDGETLELSELPPLDVDTRIGIVGETPGGATDERVPANTLAYGEVVLDEALATGLQEVSLEVPWPRVDAVGEIATVTGAERRMGGAAVAVSGGSMFVFGGGNPDSAETFNVPGQGNIQIVSSDGIFEVARDGTGWSDALVEVGKIPESVHLLGTGYTDTVTSGRGMGMSATPIETNDGTLILVAGGRYTFSFSAFQTPSWFLWDPVAKVVVDQATAENELWFGRSEHLAIPIGNQKVLFYGGLIDLGIGETPRYEVWSYNTRSSVLGPQNSGLQAASLNAFGAPFGTDAVVCGGSLFVPFTDTTEWQPLDLCHQFDPVGGRTAFEPLPVPLAAASMAPLADGGLLVTGGMEVTLVDQVSPPTTDVVPAVNRAWRYDPVSETWSEVGSMLNPRAHHASTLLADGRVLLVGGTETGTSLYGVLTDPVECTEVFDPESNTFSATTCTDVGSGANPSLGGTTEGGFAALQGYWYGPGIDGGGGAGYVGGQPAP